MTIFSNNNHPAESTDGLMSRGFLLDAPPTVLLGWLKNHHGCHPPLVYSSLKPSRWWNSGRDILLTFPVANSRTLAFPMHCPFFGARAKSALAQLPPPGLLGLSLVWRLRSQKRVVESRTVFLKEASSTLEWVTEKACSCLLPRLLIPSALLRCAYLALTSFHSSLRPSFSSSVAFLHDFSCRHRSFTRGRSSLRRLPIWWGETLLQGISLNLSLHSSKTFSFDFEGSSAGCWVGSGQAFPMCPCHWFLANWL